MDSKRKRRSQVQRRDQRAVYRSLRLLSDVGTRNLVRGVIGQDQKGDPAKSAVSLVRRHAHPDDLHVATSLLIGKTGAFPFDNLGRTYRDLLLPHTLDDISPSRELAFVVGHINGWKDTALEIIGSIEALSPLPTATPTDALGALTVFAERWGASNFLAKKIGYVVANSTENVSSILDHLFLVIGQYSHPQPHFTAIESIDIGFQYFYSMSTRIQAYSRFDRRDYRQNLSLHNIIASPISDTDMGPFLRKSHSMSLIDEIVALVQLIHTSSAGSWIAPQIERLLDPSIYRAIISLADKAFDASQLFSSDEPENADEVYFRNSLAFLEFREPCVYRHSVDQIIGPRLLARVTSFSDRTESSISPPTRTDLSKALYGFRKPRDYHITQSCGRFLRTVQFLRYLDHKPVLSDLTHYDIRYIFEHTTSLDTLISPDEIERLYLSVDADSRPLVSVFALALHKARANSDDVDFKFRLSLSNTIIRLFNRKIENFIEWLSGPTPQIANYLVYILDRTTLQKMYWLVSSADEADLTRQKILRIAGRALERIDYFVEADSIEAQRQVSSLRQYFDDSRIFVDGVAMKKWMLEHPSSYAQQYTRTIEHLSDRPTGSILILQTDPSASRSVDITVMDSHDYILRELFKIVFREFCTNANFGIESYLSRRIRHNTMSGMMRSGVEDVVERLVYRALHYDSAFLAAHTRWIENYRAQIEQIRGEYLQFRTQNRPRGLFTDEVGFGEEQTATNLRILKKAAWTARGNSDLFNELLIRHCWRQIDPQLSAASVAIMGELLQRAYDAVDDSFAAFDAQLYAQFKAELRSEIHDRFARLASWFRQPESGFVKASTRQLGELVLHEIADRPSSTSLSWAGNALDDLMDGLSVHRMYDCLSVVIRNAIKYGCESGGITVNVQKTDESTQTIARFEIEVASSISPDNAAEHMSRIEQSFADSELGASMVREGYSGIKKLRFIVLQSEGSDTTAYNISSGVCRISFSITVELSTFEEVIR